MEVYTNVGLQSMGKVWKILHVNKINIQYSYDNKLTLESLDTRLKKVESILYGESS